MKTIKQFFSRIIRNILLKCGFTPTSEIPTPKEEKVIKIYETSGKSWDITKSHYQRILVLMYGEEKGMEIYLNGPESASVDGDELLRQGEERFNQMIAEIEAQKNEGEVIDKFTVTPNRDAIFNALPKGSILDKYPVSETANVSGWDKVKNWIKNLFGKKN